MKICASISQMKLIEPSPSFPLKKWKEEKRNRQKIIKGRFGASAGQIKQFRHEATAEKKLSVHGFMRNTAVFRKRTEPHKYNNREIVAAVMERIGCGIWLPEQGNKIFLPQETHYRNRIEKNYSRSRKYCRIKNGEQKKNRTGAASNDLAPCSFIGTDFKMLRSRTPF